MTVDYAAGRDQNLNGGARRERNLLEGVLLLPLAGNIGVGKRARPKKKETGEKSSLSFSGGRRRASAKFWSGERNCFEEGEREGTTLSPREEEARHSFPHEMGII